MDTADTIKVTDYSTGETLTIDPEDFEEAVSEWFYTADPEVIDVVKELATLVTAPFLGGKVSELADQIGLVISP